MLHADTLDTSKARWRCPYCSRPLRQTALKIVCMKGVHFPATPRIEETKEMIKHGAMEYHRAGWLGLKKYEPREPMVVAKLDTRWG